MFNRVSGTFNSPTHPEESSPRESNSVPQPPSRSVSAITGQLHELPRRSASPADTLLQTLPPRTVGNLPSFHHGNPSGVWPRQLPAMLELDPDELAVIHSELPQLENESKQEYARRLHRKWPHLSILHISILSGVRESNLKEDPAFHDFPSALSKFHD